MSNELDAYYESSVDEHGNHQILAVTQVQELFMFLRRSTPSN